MNGKKWDGGGATGGAVESFANAAATIGQITPGMGLFAVTRGQWMISRRAGYEG